MSDDLRERFETALNDRFTAKSGPLDDVVRQSHYATADLAHSVYGPELERLPTCTELCMRASDVGVRVEGNPVAQPHRSCPEHGDPVAAVWELNAALRKAEELLSARDEEMERLRTERDAARLAYNGANAMTRVHKRRADLLRERLDDATAALAGDSEGVRLFMADHDQRVERMKEQARLASIDADNNEAELNRIVTEIEAERDKTRDAEGATLRDEHVINGIVNGLGIALRIARGES